MQRRGAEGDGTDFDTWLVARSVPTCRYSVRGACQASVQAFRRAARRRTDAAGKARRSVD